MPSRSHHMMESNRAAGATVAIEVGHSDTCHANGLDTKAHLASLASIVDAGGSIQAMQVCTPADASVTALSPERLRWIAEQAQEKGLNARVY